MKATTLDESVIQDIGHAFGYYDYGTERGLINAFPSREATAVYISGYVRMALRGGVLYTTSENGEAYIAYKLPGEKLSLSAMMCLVKGLFSSMGFKDFMRFLRIMGKTEPGSTSALTRRRSRISSSAWSACANSIRVRAICAGSWSLPSQRATGSVCR